jgi:hypothetical protein
MQRCQKLMWACTVHWHDSVGQIITNAPPQKKTHTQVQRMRRKNLRPYASESKTQTPYSPQVLITRLTEKYRRLQKNIDGFRSYETMLPRKPSRKFNPIHAKLHILVLDYGLQIQFYHDKKIKILESSFTFLGSKCTLRSLSSYNQKLFNGTVKTRE